MEEKYGEAITIANSEDEKKNILNKYIRGKPEEITSKLAVEPVLRSSILGLISSGIISDKEQLFDFFSSTFYGFQYKDNAYLNNKLEQIVKKLKNYEFILEQEGSLKPTVLGKRISELYLDPESAYVLIKGLRNGYETMSIFSLLHLISYTIEMEPLRFKGSDWENIQNEIVKHEKEILIKIPEEWDPEYDFFLSSVSTALILQEWVDEKSEEYILEKHNIRPGELYVKLQNSEWLLYSCREISRILELKNLQASIQKARLRIKYGIRENLLPLVKLKSIGRVRARKLFNLGIKNLGDLRKIEINKLSRTLGKKVSIYLKSQVGVKVNESEVKEAIKKGQQELSFFEG